MNYCFRLLSRNVTRSNGNIIFAYESDRSACPPNPQDTDVTSSDDVINKPPHPVPVSRARRNKTQTLHVRFCITDNNDGMTIDLSRHKTSHRVYDDVLNNSSETTNSSQN